MLVVLSHMCFLVLSYILDFEDIKAIFDVIFTTNFQFSVFLVQFTIFVL